MPVQWPQRRGTPVSRPLHQVAARELGASLAAHDVYVAGPPALVEAVRAAYPPLGVAPDDIHFDSFDYAPR